MLYPATGSDELAGFDQLRSTWWDWDWPTPLSATVAVEALLAIASWPENDPAVVGSNRTSRVSDCPGFSVAGRAAPEAENPVPLTVAEFTVTGAVPVELSVNACVAAVFSATLPNPIEVAFGLSFAAPVAGETVMMYVVDALPALAVMVATCVVVTAATVALNPVVIAPGLTVTALGTDTAGLLLARVTGYLPFVAVVRYTEQASVAAALKVLLVHEMRLRAGVLCAAEAAAVVTSNARRVRIFPELRGEMYTEAGI